MMTLATALTTGIGNFMDSVILQIAPSWPTKRSRARLRLQADRLLRVFLSTYAAAERNRLSRIADFRGHKSLEYSGCARLQLGQAAVVVRR